jgi:N-acetylmuramoyl-L-alanine amidase
MLGLARSEENRAVQQRENSVILLEDNYKQRYQGFDPNSPESYIIFEFMTNKFMEQSLDFATSLQENFKTIARRPDRGVKQAGFLVLRETAMPSVLIELGFINNNDDAKYLSSAIGQRALASAIFAGFKHYKKEFDNNQGSKNIASSNSKGSEESTFVSKTSQPLPQQSGRVSQQDTQPAATQQTGNNSVYISKPKQDPLITSKVQPAAPQTQKPENTAAIPVVRPDEAEYRIQILVTDFEIASDSPKLKGVSPVSFYFHNGAYKYTYGSTADRNEAVRILREMKPKFKDAFIVEFKNGKRVK